MTRALPFGKTLVSLFTALWAGVVLGPMSSAAGLGTPLVAQAGAGLVAPGGMEEMAKPTKQLPAGAQKMADNFNKAGTADAVVPPGNAAAADGAAAAAGPGLSGDLVKYAPSYVIMVLTISLGLFVVCRPAGFSLASLADKKPKPKH